MSYTSLHGHTESSNFRLLDSISKPSQILDKAHELGLNGIAITDHESLSSFIKAEKYLTTKRSENESWNNLKLIRGNEIYLVRNGLNKDNFVRGEDQFYHFILLARDPEGYRQLCELSSRAWKRAYKYYQVRVPTYYQDLIDIIGDNRGHLIGSTACIGGQIGSKLLAAKNGRISLDEAIVYDLAWLSRMQEILGKDNLFLEMQPGITEEQIFCNKQIIDLAKNSGIATIITTDHHYTNKEDRKVHKAYLKSKSGEREVDSFYEATYMMSAEEIHQRMDSQIGKHEVNKALQNTNLICDRINEYSLLKPLQIPYLPKPEFDLDCPVDHTMIAAKVPNIELYFNSTEVADQQFAARLTAFMNECDEGSSDRRLNCDNKCKQMDTELGIIWDASQKMKVSWSKYFLQVADYINLYWTEGDSILCPSRGSAGASYVCYALGIIQIDPTREKAPLIFERFMNPDRASVLDIDIDIQSNRRNQCIAALQNTYGIDHVTRVSTFKTEKARSAILTAARALDIDVDTARYISSLVKAERGIQYTLTQTYYGDEENDIAPNSQFISEMEKYPELWEIAQKIEGLISGLGSHAGGVIITEEPIKETCGIMKTSSGDIVTAYDLHEAEDLGLIKIDLLATEGLSKIRVCLDLLCENGFIERKPTLKETYESVIGVYNLDRTNDDMWKMVWNNEITALFQMEQQSGIQGIALTKPHSLEDLATLNSVIRLMPPDKNAERPLEKFARFRLNPSEWDDEMDEWGLNDHEKELMHSMFDYSNGIAAQQEDLYQLMRCPEIVGYSFGDADKLRKAVAKKSPKDYQAFEEQFWKDVAERGSSKNLCNYIWNVLVASQRGYSFNLAHCFSYSIVALQEMNLAHRFPIILWNTANLIVDSGAEYIADKEESEEVDDLYYGKADDEEVEIEEDDDEDEDEEDKVTVKKKTTTSDYGKIASAIGRMQKIGIKVLPPNINKSEYTYTPNVKENTIRYGMKGIIKVGDAVVDSILKNRPYTSIEDFLNKVKVNKTQMINLIKSGAFDSFGDRQEIMTQYINLISDVKKKLTLQNVGGLITHNLIPDEYNFQQRVFNFNKYIRKFKNKETNLITMDEVALRFYNANFDQDKLQVTEDGTTYIDATIWKGYYDIEMAKLRTFIVNKQAELLSKFNNELTSAVWEKYAKGTLDKWSMDSVCFYQDHHELEFANLEPYGVEDFYTLPVEPQIASSFPAKDGHMVHLYKLTKIAGTVIDKDKNKSQITLLTTGGVVTVKAYGVMPQYDKQISARGADGKKHVVEKSWFTRGNKIIVHGMRSGESTFIAKKYQRQAGHHFNLIKEVHPDGTVDIQETRVEVTE